MNESEQSLAMQRERVVALARARVWGVFASAAVGVLCASRVDVLAWQSWWGPLLLALAVFAMAATLVMRRARLGVWALGFVAAALLGASAWWAWVVWVPQDRLSELGMQRGSIITVEGVVADGVRVLPQNTGIGMQPRSEMLLHLRGIVREASAQQASGQSTSEQREGVQRVSGTLRVRVSGKAIANPRAGDRVRVMGRFEPPQPATNPGEPDRVALARGKGDVGTLTTSSWELVSLRDELVHNHTGDGLLRWALSLRQQSKQAVLASLPSEPKARWLMSALLLGESEERDDEAMSTFARVGVIHLVAISGFHLTVIALVMLWLMRLLGDRGWLEPLLVAAGLIAYASLTPLSPALLRAVVLTLLVLATQSTGRRADSLCVLGLGALGLLLVVPWAVVDLGFQLSLGLTALLLWAQRSFAARFAGLPPAGVLYDKLTPLQWLLRGARTASAASVMCWVVSVPWMMASVGIVSPAGLIASLLLSPLFVVLLVCGVVCSAVSSVLAAIAPDAAAWLTTHATGPAIGWLCNLVLSTVKVADQVPGAWAWVPTTPWWWTIIATTALACWARFGVRSDQLRVRKWLVGLLVLAAISLPAAWHLRTKLAGDVQLRIDMLDVGDGTCMLVRTQNAAMLWDVKRARWARTQPGVLAACRELGAWRVPTVAISHPDSDHCTGLAEVLAPLGVREVLTTQRFIDATTGAQAQPVIAAVLASVTQARARVTLLQAGAQVILGPAVTTSVLWPDIAEQAQRPQAPSDNELSLVIALDVATSAGTVRVLLTGDVQNDGAEKIARQIAAQVQAHGPYAIVEAPHHGAANAGGIAILTASKSRVVLQSTGPSRLDDPRLNQARMGEWLVTARDGWAWAEVLRSGELRFGR